MSVEEVAALARDVADRFGASPDGIEGAQEVRRALLAVAGLPDAGGDGTPGGAGAGFVSWVRANADEPALRRLDLVLTALAIGGAPLPRFALDVAAFRKAMAGMARDGDAEAATALAILDRPLHRRSPASDSAGDIPLARMSPGLDIASLPEDGPADGEHRTDRLADVAGRPSPPSPR